MTETKIKFDVHFAPQDQHIKEIGNNKNCWIWAPSTGPKKKGAKTKFFLHPHEGLLSIECDEKTDYGCLVDMWSSSEVFVKKSCCQQAAGRF